MTTWRRITKILVKGRKEKLCILKKRKGKNNIDHYIRECEIAREWFTGLDKNEEDKKDLINLIKIRKG